LLIFGNRLFLFRLEVARIPHKHKQQPVPGWSTAGNKPRRTGGILMAAGVLDLTAATFDTTIAAGVTLVDFWAPWCGPCRMQGPILEQIVGAVAGRATIAKVNVDEAADIAAKYQIRSIPALMVFKDGQVVKSFVGLQRGDVLLQAIEAACK
jgi:thioredoxin 1